MRESRLYSLYEKQGGKWVRLSSAEWTKSVAVSLWQNDLLAPVLGGGGTYPVKGVRSLRPVPKLDADEAYRKHAIFPD